MRKTILSTDNKNDIVKLYQTNELRSTHKLAERYKTTHKEISKILKDNNVQITTRGGQVRNTNKFVIQKEQLDCLLVCKLTGKEFKDTLNKSGTITEHISKTYPDYVIPTAHLRRQHYKNNGLMWYDEFFDRKDKTINPTRKCGLCDWTTEDIDNRTGCFINHLKDDHNKSIDDYLIDFPDDIKYHSLITKNKEKNEFLNKEGNHVVCKECGKKMRSIGISHLKYKHNMTPVEYKLKYGINNIISDTTLDLLRQNMVYTNINSDMNHFTSNAENEIKTLLESNGINCTLHDRKILNGKEIDILIPDYRLGIEYHGLKYHTEKGEGKKNKWFHYNKLINANISGYSLIQIFEDEWLINKDICKKKILNILGKNNTIKIGARKCIIKEISYYEKNIFLKDNHVQGSDMSSNNIGAYYNNDLVGVMTFTKKNENKEYELSRFATKIDLKIVGLGSKLVTYFIKNYSPKTITSFADARWTINKNNNLYTKMGFSFVKHLNPDYRYVNINVDRRKRFHKFLFRKKILSKKYGLDISMTETEMITVLGYDRIWDCGLYKYKLTIPQLDNVNLNNS